MSLGNMPLVNCATPLGHDTSSSDTNLGTVSKNQIDSACIDSALVLETKVVSRSSGSARLKVPLANVDILVTIYGPRSPQTPILGNTFELECDLHYAPFVSIPFTSMDDDDEKANVESTIAEQVKNGLRASIRGDRYMKSTISMFITILGSSSHTACDMSYAITCASLALADAGIELYDLIAASTWIFIREAPKEEEKGGNDSNLLLRNMTQYPLLGQLHPSQIAASTTVASIQSQDATTQLLCRGGIDFELVQKSMSMACDYNVELREQLSEHLKDRVE